MKRLGNLNTILIVIIIALIAAILSFNYGYKLGERRGYVMGVQKCLEDFDQRSHTPQTQRDL